MTVVVVVVVPLIIMQENERKDREWLIVLWLYSSADITTPNPHTVTPSDQPFLTTAQHDLVSHPSTTASSYSSGIVLRNLIHEHLLSLKIDRRVIKKTQCTRTFSTAARSIQQGLFAVVLILGIHFSPWFCLRHPRDRHWIIQWSGRGANWLSIPYVSWVPDNVGSTWRW